MHAKVAESTNDQALPAATAAAMPPKTSRSNALSNASCDVKRSVPQGQAIDLEDQRHRCEYREKVPHAGAK